MSKEELRAALGHELMKALDVVNDEADSLSLRLEIVAGSALDLAPPILHVWTLNVVGGEWQAATHVEKVGGRVSTT